MYMHAICCVYGVCGCMYIVIVLICIIIIPYYLYKLYVYEIKFIINIDWNPSQLVKILNKLLLKYEPLQLFTKLFNQNILCEEVILKIVTNMPPKMPNCN